MSRPLAGRTALVTGGGGPGMGSAHCHALASAGAHVIVQDVRQAEADAVVGSLRASGGKAESMIGDIADLDRFLPRVRERLTGRGVIDIVVHHAGISGRNTPFESIDAAFFDRMFAVHVRATFFLTQLLVPAMKAQRWGRIVLIASDFALAGSPAASHYTAAKAALLGLTKAWAKEFAPWQICVNAVAPTLMRSELTLASVGPAFIEAEAAKAPMGRLPTPEEVAAVVAFLASPAASAVTGQTISPGAGRTIVGG
ncbi:MAG: SDR family oxidoreductase [Alphaproteobacteria bacterium]|nr:SDR family oxidoreductase [Alphaproteobacteria bacterium]